MQKSPARKGTPTPAKNTSEHRWESASESDGSRWCPACGRLQYQLRDDAPPCEPPRDYKLAVKNVKSFEGNEGIGFSATLYIDGKRAGYVKDDAWGGSYDYGLAHELLADLNRWARVKNASAYAEELDLIVARIVEDYEEAAKLRRLCKKKTVFQTSSQARGEYMTINRPYSPLIAEHIRSKYGQELVEIVNERKGL